MFFFSLFSPLIFYKSIFFYYNLCYRFDKFIQLTKIIFLYFLIDFFILFFNIKLIKNHRLFLDLSSQSVYIKILK
jgi:hypothetical protein